VTFARGFAACVASAAWLGLGVQLAVSFITTGNVWTALWTILGYFTITTNLLLAVVFTWLAMRRVFTRNWIVAGTALSILMVGVVYVLLLHGTVELSGNAVIADRLLHFVTPLLGPLFWIFCTPKGTLNWRHPFLWAMYPLGYFAYGMLRGAATGRYAYPFLDVDALGWGRTAANASVISVGFMACGFAMVWIDQRIGRKTLSMANR
jgi:hypothetical protein